MLDALASLQVDTLELAPALAKIEDSMRQALRQHAAVHVVERTVLLRAVGRVGGKSWVSLLCLSAAYMSYSKANCTYTLCNMLRD